MTSVLVGMSGGIDSSFTAHLLKQKGMQVYGLFLHMAGKTDLLKQKKVQDICKVLGIPFQIEDCSGVFNKQIIDPFVESYLKGSTPNPCVICNAEVKFKLLFSYADRNGIDLVSTGHYARISRNGCGSYSLLRGLDPNKDQSYMLYRLEKEWLSRLIFPLGVMDKSDIRDLSENIFGPMLKNETESQDICFLPDTSLKDLLTKRAGNQHDHTGPIEDTKGTILGKHMGVFRYTIGQRRGLGLGGGPWFVLAIDPARNAIVVGSEKELFPNIINCTFPVWHGNVSIGDEFHAQHRYRAQPVRIKVTSVEKGHFTVNVLGQMKAPAPGQSLVLYREDKVVGGGIILSTGRF